MIIKPKFTYLFKSFLIVGFLMLVSCGDNVMPKPKSYLRLEYPEANYKKTNLNLPFSFEANTLANKIVSKKVEATTESYGVNIEYKSLKGTIFLTYKSIERKQENLIAFLQDAEKFTEKHMTKADEIPYNMFENKERHIYGKFSEVKGNVASLAQFYVTDSVNHFLTGSLYFYAKPNYDSILPAANYLQKDIKRIMETLVWKLE